MMRATKPHAGLYSDGDLFRLYNEMYDALNDFMPSDTSEGNLSIKGTASKARAKAKELVFKARALEEMTKAITAGRL